MEEINLIDLLNFFAKKIYIIILFTVLGATIATIYATYYQVPLYRSETTLLLTATAKQDNETITQNDILINQKLVTTYREIIKSNKVLKRVKSDLKLDYSIAKLSSNVSVSTVKDTEIIEISVSDESAYKATEIANRIAAVFSEEIVGLYNIQNIGVIDEAEATNVPYNVKLAKQQVLGGGAGLMGALVVVFLFFYFDTTIKSVEEVEKKLGLPIIGLVPIRKRG